MPAKPWKSRETKTVDMAGAGANPRPIRRLPLIRHISSRISVLLYRTPVTANHVTLAGAVFGIAAAWCFLQTTFAANLIGAALFFVSYLCSHCDGELARLKRHESAFGQKLSEFCGFIVHAALLIALGENGARTFGSDVWAWLGYLGAAGTAINFGVAMMMKGDFGSDTAAHDDLAHTIRPEDVARSATALEKTIFVFRELMAADFCFVLLAVALIDMPWLLVPPAAIGTHIYWIAGLYENAQKYHA